MTLYVLDTDTVQLYQDENPKAVSRVQAVAPTARAISVVTVEEQLSEGTRFRECQVQRLALFFRSAARRLA